MKLSNFMLAIVAGCSLYTAIYVTNSVPQGSPTSVLNISTGDKSVGGGFSIKLPDNYTPRQARILASAYEIAKRDGHPQPQLLQAIVLRETDAGAYKAYKVAGQEFGLKTNERYYGVAQLKLVAAKEVLRRYPELWDKFNFQTRMDEEIIAKMIENDEFNLSLASKYLLIVKAFGYNTAREMALAYNQGVGGAKTKDPNSHPYSNGVMANIQKLKM